MPKRKRSTEDLVLEQLATARQNLSRALKVAKGFERQRLAKRIYDEKTGSEKKQRLEREVLVLKSLDLGQVANAHLVSSIVRIKAAAQSEQLPEDIKRGVKKPDLPDQEQAALHNVTSSLYNRPEVRKVVEKAVAGICALLGVEVAQKRGKGKKRADTNREGGKGERPADRRREQSSAAEATWPAVGDDAADLEDDAADDEKLAGFSDEDNMDAALSHFDSRIAGSSDEDDDDLEVDENRDAEDISLPGSMSDDDSRSPPPKRQATKHEEPAKPARPGESTFLPMLMGGYVDDSDSEASDLEKELNPRKNRRGQRERQKIWEQKYKDRAKHLQKQKDGRNSGWDMKRGAVDTDNNKPWKNGVRTPFRQDRERDAPRETQPQQTHMAKELTGKLHPSWDAARKAKEKQKNATFTGSKVVFS